MLWRNTALAFLTLIAGAGLTGCRHGGLQVSTPASHIATAIPPQLTHSPTQLSPTSTPTMTPEPTSTPLPTSTPTPPATPTPAPYPVDTAARNMVMMGQIGGAVKALAVQGQYAYLGEGPRLIILDVSDPATPTLVGRTIPLPGVIEDLVVRGSIVYAAVGHGGLGLVDVSNRAAPVLRGSYDTPGIASAVRVVRNWAYVADGEGGLRILDISDPASPVESTFYEFDPGGDLSGSVKNLALTDGHVYVTGISSIVGGDGMRWGYGWVRVMAIDSPVDLRVVGDFLGREGVGPPLYPQDVMVLRDSLYISNGNSVLILDVSQPHEPTRAGLWSFSSVLGGAAFSVSVCDEGDRVYLGGYEGFRMLDGSGPGVPTEIGSYATGEMVTAFAVQEGIAYIAEKENGLQILDISDPASPKEMGLYASLGSALRVAATDSSVYVIDNHFDLRIFDVHSSPDPTEIGFYAFPGMGSVSDVVPFGNLVYVGHGGLRILDVSDPSAPTEVGSYGTQGGVGCIEISEEETVGSDECRLYVTGGSDLRLLDISDPTRPIEISAYHIPDPVHGLAVSNGRACVATGWTGLRVIDFSSPDSPTEIGSYEIGGYASAVTASGGYAYVVNSETGLQTLPVTDPDKAVSFANRPVEDALVQNNLAYLALRSDGLQVLDVSVPSDLNTEVGFYDTPGSAVDVAVMGDRVLVADDEGGLVVLHLLGGAGSSGVSATPTPTRTPGPDGTVVHVVQPGDTLSAIAQSYGVSVAAIVSANGLTSDAVHVGQELMIPVPSGVAEATPNSTEDTLPVWSMRRHDAQRTGRTEHAGPENPALVWIFEGQGSLSIPVIAADGKLYLDAGGGDLRALDSSGSEKWSYSLSGNRTSRLAIADDGTLYAIQGRNLYAIDPSSATQDWAYSADGTIRDLAIAADGTVYLASDQLHAVDPTDGTAEWVSSGNECRGLESVAIGPSGDVYALSTLDVCAYTPAGQFRWKEWTAPGARGINNAITIGPPENVYVNGEAAAGAGTALPTSSLTILDRNGQLDATWNYILAPPAIGQDGILYLGWREIGETVETEDGRVTPELGPPQLLARSPSAGDVWRYPLGDSLCSYPVIGADETVYIALCNGDVQAFGRGGDLKWTLNIGAFVEDGPRARWDLAIGKGRLYVATEGTLYAIGESN